MNAIFHLVISTTALMLFQISALKSQTANEDISLNSITENTSNLNAKKHNEPVINNLAVSEDKLQNFLDDLGKPLLNNNDRKPQDSAEGDSFQEYSFTGAATVDYYGFTVASAGDVNADGFDDIIVGAPFNDAGGPDAGRAYIYFGSYVIDYTADVILTGIIAGGRLGYSVSSAGDVNNDGYADVIAGATGISANTGGAYIYYGGSNMNNVADVTLSGQSAGEQFGYSVSNAGDVNGDGYSDVVVGAYAYAGFTGRVYAFFGSAFMDNNVDIIFASGDAGSGYGISVSSAGDVNADGYRDIIVSELFDPGSYGKAFIYHGGQSMDNVADVTMTGATPADYFGSSVSSAGDMNGDGFDDVIVGAIYFNSQTGAAYIYYGGATMNNTADVTLNGVAGTDFFGGSVAGAGDVNGDGFKDVIIGARQNDVGGVNSGCAYLFWGGTIVNNVPDAVFSGSIVNDQFGFSVASAGDFNRDGYTDLIIGTPYNDESGSDAGKAWLYTNTRNYVATPIASFSGPGGNDFFGRISKSAGDVNGDGFDDVLVNSLNTQQVHLFFGGSFINNTVDVVFNAQNGSESFGVSVSTAGDVNSDGYSDIIIGAETSNSTIGRAYIFFGGISMDNIPDLILFGQALNQNFGSSVSYAGDVNNDNYDDVIVGTKSAGKAYLFFGGNSMNNIADVVFTGPGGIEFAVTDAGDINGDTYDDVAVGAYQDAGGLGKVFVYHGGASMNNVADVIITGSGTNNFLGSKLSNAGDVNADGYPDLIVVGNVPTLIGNDTKGKVQVFFGGPAMDVLPDITMTGYYDFYFLGSSVSTLGDYNKDGYTDFVVSAGLLGRVYIFFGGPSVDNVPDYVISSEKVNGSLTIGMSASYAGDVNGDGSPDLIAGGHALNAPGNSYIFTYSNSSGDISDEGFVGESASDLLGFSVATAGDINNDGYSDVIVGARLNDAAGTNAGRAYIYFGGNPMDYIPEVILNGTYPGEQFGWSVSSAGDVNKDGYSDVIVGAPLNDAAGEDAGRAYIFFGGPSMNNIADVVLTGESTADNFGYSVASAGNFNGNGFNDIWDDVIVGSFYNDGGGLDAGRAYVYYGGNTMDNFADIIFTGLAAGDRLGVSVASAGDVNGDSYGDIIVGASRNDIAGTNAGAAYIFHGALTPDNIVDATIFGTGSGDEFGSSVACAGDMDGDGMSDVIIGGYGNDIFGSDAGMIRISLGGNPNVGPAFYGESANDWFGSSVASAGDVNGDGYSDVIVGSYLNDAGGSNAGRAYIYFGGTSFFFNTAADIIMTGEPADYFGWSVANAGDVNGDGLSDPLVGAYLNSQSAPNAGKGYLFLSSYPENHCILSLKVIPQAFYNPGNETMSISDTVTVNLRSSSFPYNIVDVAKAVVNKTSFISKFYFRNAPSGNYYLDIRHRNSIETWSASPVTLTRNVNTNYDLTTAANKSYGSNMIQIDNSPVRFAVYSGDVNQDGIVDASDALMVDNDANIFATGYVVTDVNGDYSVDATDALIVDNNSNNFVSKITP